MDWLFTYADPTIDWDYAMITLVVRFIGVFVVMGVMQVALQVSSVVVRRYEARSEPMPAAAPASQVQSPAAPIATVSGLDDATAAAIGTALEIEFRSAPAVAAGRAGEGGSAWAAAGRWQQLNRAPR